MSAESPLPLAERIVPYSDNFGTFEYGVELDLLNSMKGTLLVVRDIVHGYEASELLDGGDAFHPAEVSMYAHELSDIRTEERFDKHGFAYSGLLTRLRSRSIFFYCEQHPEIKMCSKVHLDDIRTSWRRVLLNDLMWRLRMLPNGAWSVGGTFKINGLLITGGCP